MANWVSRAVTGITDSLGLTDSGAADRAARAAKEGLDRNQRQLERDTSAVRGMFSDAMDGRSISQNLANYGNEMQSAKDLNWETMGAGEDIDKYLNPEMDAILDKTAQRVNDSAGAALQSSATTDAMTRALSDTTASLWDSAFSKSIQSAQNKRATAQNAAGLAGSTLAANNEPAMTWANLESDLAMNKYNGGNSLLSEQVKAAGTPRTIL